jgi:hypothetical protein
VFEALLLLAAESDCRCLCFDGVSDDDDEAPPLPPFFPPLDAGPPPFTGVAGADDEPQGLEEAAEVPPSPP